MNVRRVIVKRTITNSRPSPRLIDTLTDVPDRDTPVVAPRHIYLVALERCDSRSKDEMIMSPPSVNVFMARIKDLIAVSGQFSGMNQDNITFAIPLDPPLNRRL